MFGAALSAVTSAKNPSNGGVNNLMNSSLGQLVTRVAEPNIPMSESYNSAAPSPVFPPATQERAAAVFGTNDQRQMSTTGFKKEIKERIVQDINSL